MALHVPPPDARHAERSCAPVVLELLPAPVPGQDPGAGVADPLLVPSRLHHHGAVQHLGGHGCLPHVLLHADGGHRVRRHAAAPHRRRLRSARAQRPPVVGPSDGARCPPAHGSHVLCRCVQEAAGVQLGDRCRVAGADVGPVVHRIPPPVGPVELLGGHRRHEPRALPPVDRRVDAELPDRRRTGGAEHAGALLRTPRRSVAERSSSSRSACTSGGSERTASPSNGPPPLGPPVRSTRRRPRRRTAPSCPAHRRPCTARGSGCSASSTASR